MLPSTRETVLRRFVAPEDARDQTAALMMWVQGNQELYHPVVVAAVMGYNLSRIHRFPDFQCVFSWLQFYSNNDIDL
jgi:hypothetical protein